LNLLPRGERERERLLFVWYCRANCAFSIPNKRK
jgi:hypothetical protein